MSTYPNIAVHDTRYDIGQDVQQLLHRLQAEREEADRASVATQERIEDYERDIRLLRVYQRGLDELSERLERTAREIQAELGETERPAEHERDEGEEPAEEVLRFEPDAGERC